MGYHGDERNGGDRWRDRDQNWNRDRGYGREQGRGGYGGGDDDRGFFDRAGDEVRSWFGDDEAQRRRESDQRRWEQEQRMTGRRDNDGGPYQSGPGSFGGGWGNQRGESWNRDRPGVPGTGGGEREGWFGDSVGGERGRRQGGSGGGGAGTGYGSGYGVPEAEQWGGSGFGGDPNRGRRFDRVDPGSVGTHGAHPMSAPVGGGFGGDFGPQSQGSGSSSRYAAIMREQQGGGQRGGDIHDPHYSEWRRRQIEDLDRDYDEYRREHQSKFESEFGSWRSRRQNQRQSLNKAAPHMEVVGSDGSHVGTVDKVAGDRIILTRSDENAGGIHHSVPCSWVETVDERVTLNKSAEEAMNEWRNEERGRALFERDNEGGDGPRNLNRSFSGTYSDREGGGDRES